MKKCTCCKLKKPYEEFHSKGNGKFASYCKPCISQIQKIKHKHRKKLHDEVINIWDESLQCQIDHEKLKVWEEHTVKNKSKLLEKWM